MAEQEKAGSQATKNTKENFNGAGMPITSLESLAEQISHYKMIPEDAVICGIPNQTGLVITSGDRVVAAIKHPDNILKSGTAKPEYGGVQTVDQIEASLAKPLGKDFAAKRAKEILDMTRNNGLEFAATNTKFMGMGNEDENIHYDKYGKPTSLPADDQIELQSCVKENPLKPTRDPYTEMLEFANMRLNETKKYKDNIINNTSFSILSKPQDLDLNNGKYKDYVEAVAVKMYQNFVPSDPIVAQFWNSVSKESGFNDFYDMKFKVGDLRIFPFLAAHANLGIRHEQGEGGELSVGLEEAIAVADMVNSDFGTVLEWMTYSTPIAFEKKIGVHFEEDGTKYPKDVRAVARLASKTTHPTEFVMDPQSYKDKAIYSIMNGISDRIDRAAYFTYHQDVDREMASAHGRVRMRLMGGSGEQEFDKTLGRIEFTGGPNTPDLVALGARNAMMKLMGMAAYEAVANKQHPTEYFGRMFPSMTKCNEQVELAHAYNFYGAEHPMAANLLAESRMFLDYMDSNYGDIEDVKYLIDLARVGVDKLDEKTEARTLKEYLQNPKGNISDVITAMYDDGHSPLDIAKAIMEFEVGQSEKLIAANGNILEMIKKECETRK